jgi:hypothetical protein
MTFFSFFLILECGLTFAANNAAFGQQPAIVNSWPATVLIYIRLRLFRAFDENRIALNMFRSCSGILINRATVLSTASCLTKAFKYAHKNQTYSIKIEPTDLTPSVDSIYDVFIGAHYLPVSGSFVNNMQHKRVKKIIAVTL